MASTLLGLRFHSPHNRYTARPGKHHPDLADKTYPRLAIGSIKLKWEIHLFCDATQPHVPEASFDLVYLCTVLGEVPDQPAVLEQAFRLKLGGLLSITEIFGDPHYQSRSRR